MNIGLFGSNYIGIDIGSGLIKISYKDKFFEIATPADAVKNGVIHEISKVSSAIKEIANANKLNGKKAIISYNGPGLFTKEVDIPLMKDSEIQDFLGLEADNILPFPVKDGVIDYLILKENPMQILVMALKGDLLTPYIDSVKKGGLIPMAVDLPALALARELLEKEEGFQVIIDLGKTTTDIHIYKGGVFRFSRIIPIGGDDFDNTLAASMGVNFEQALKDRLSNSYEPMIFKGILADIQRELVRSIDYFRYRHGNEHSLEFTKVFLIGGSSSIIGFSDIIEEITFSKPVIKEDARSLLVKGLSKWRDNQ